jgi:dolichol-phosphate mannosyltransferase
MTPDLSIVIPIFNEEATLMELYRRVTEVLDSLERRYELVLVNDGSSDGSAKILNDIHDAEKGKVRVIHLSRNFGHQLALSAGLENAKGKAVIVMDADLQDPPEIILEFVRKWDEGYKIVYGVREERQGETWFKKWTASVFYRIIRWLSKIDIQENVGDFYLLDRKVVEVFKSFKERNRFIRGLVALGGLKKTGVKYVRKSRYAGETKYPFWKMVKFSFDAITSFSFTPLRMVSMVGATFAMVSFIAILIIIYEKLFTDLTVTGWSSLMAVILFLGGVQLMAIGAMGEYIARIGDDVKARPLYVIDEIRE